MHLKIKGSYVSTRFTCFLAMVRKVAKCRATCCSFRYSCSSSATDENMSLAADSLPPKVVTSSSSTSTRWHPRAIIFVDTRRSPENPNDNLKAQGWVTFDVTSTRFSFFKKHTNHSSRPVKPARRTENRWMSWFSNKARKKWELCETRCNCQK